MHSEQRALLETNLNPVSAVFGHSSFARYFKGECGPVCSGKVPCNVREARRAG